MVFIGMYLNTSSSNLTNENIVDNDVGPIDAIYYECGLLCEDYDKWENKTYYDFRCDQHGKTEQTHTTKFGSSFLYETLLIQYNDITYPIVFYCGGYGLSEAYESCEEFIALIAPVEVRFINSTGSDRKRNQ